MIKSDSHVHTEFSNDCSVKIEQQIEKAIELGLKFISITDHCEMDYLSSEKENDYILDTNTYVQKINMLKEKYRKQINVLCGVEIGLRPYLKERISNYVNSYNFDFIIGSSHAVNGIDIGFNFDEFFKGKNEKQAYREYFEYTLENVKTFDNYKDLFAEILKIIIKNGKGTEVNTAGLRKNLGYPHPHKDILKMYKDLGGEIITIGSDAHLPEHIGYKFEDIPEILKSIGFNYYTVFENQNPKFYKL